MLGFLVNSCWNCFCLQESILEFLPEFLLELFWKFRLWFFPGFLQVLLPGCFFRYHSRDWFTNLSSNSCQDSFRDSSGKYRNFSFRNSSQDSFRNSFRCSFRSSSPDSFKHLSQDFISNSSRNSVKNTWIDSFGNSSTDSREIPLRFGINQEVSMGFVQNVFLGFPHKFLQRLLRDSSWDIFWNSFCNSFQNSCQDSITNYSRGFFRSCSIGSFPNSFRYCFKNWFGKFFTILFENFFIVWF